MSTKKEQPKLSYYYIRGVDNKPVATVAISVVDLIVCRGIAICSSGIPNTGQASDQWNRKIGRKHATGRCYKAMGTKESSDPIGIEPAGGKRPIADSVMSFMMQYPEFVHKSGHNVRPTDQESKILSYAAERSEPNDVACQSVT